MGHENASRETFSKRFRKARAREDRDQQIYDIVRELSRAEEHAIFAIRFRRFVNGLPAKISTKERPK